MFKQIATIGGAVVGGMLGGPAGASAGATIGSSVGNAVDPDKPVVQGTAPQQRNEGALMNMFRQSSKV